MFQIAHGVKYMHSIGIVHRDLKPENILCVKPNSIESVKIADFGISKMVKPEFIEDSTFSTMVGTLSYTAPEILRGKGYNKSVDYWSLGVIMYILLCGYAPFWGESDSEVRSKFLFFLRNHFTLWSRGTPLATPPCFFRCLLFSLVFIFL